MGVGYHNGGQKEQDRAARSGAPDADEQAPGWSDLKEDVGSLAEAALEQGRSFLGTAKAQATGYVDRRKDDAAQSVADIANSLRETSRSFEEQPNIRAFFDSAAEGLDQLADNVRQRSFAEIYTELEDMMRRRPMAVAAVTMAAGFLVSRFIKASAEAVQEEQRRRREWAAREGAERARRRDLGSPA